MAVIQSLSSLQVQSVSLNPFGPGPSPLGPFTIPYTLHPTVGPKRPQPPPHCLRPRKRNPTPLYWLPPPHKLGFQLAPPQPLWWRTWVVPHGRLHRTETANVVRRGFIWVGLSLPFSARYWQRPQARTVCTHLLVGVNSNFRPLLVAIGIHLVQFIVSFKRSCSIN